MGRVPVDCPCGHKVSARSDLEPGISEKDGFTVVQCQFCGILRTSEREENYEALYTEGDRYHVQEMDKIGREHYTDRFQHDFDIGFMSRLPKIHECFRSLDVGCANGAFVAAMAVEGYAAEGLELNPTMAAFAREETGVPIHESWDTVKGKFEVITYHDVFEHIVDPRAELELIRDHLHPNGLLVLDCPDAEEVFGPEARARHHEKPDQHLFYYTAGTLRAMLASHQFIVQNIDKPLVGKVVVYARKNGE